MAPLRVTARLFADGASPFRRFRFGRAAIPILILAAAAGLVGALPVSMAIVVLALMIALIIFAVVRKAFTAQSSTVGSDLAQPRNFQAPRDSFGVPRLLYYGGILTIAQLTFRLPLNFTLSDWLFFAALVLTVLVLLAFHRRVTVEIPILILLGALIFGVGSLVSSLSAALPLQSVAVGARVFYIVTVWFWLGTVLLRDIGQVSTAVRLWTISAAITGAGAIAQLTWGDVIPGATPSWGRMTGFTPHMTDLGGICCLALVPALWLATQTRGRSIQKLVSFASVALIGAGLVLSGSVGSLLAAAVAVFLWLALGAVSLRTMAVTVVLAGLIAVPSLAILEQVGGISPATRLYQVIESEGEEGSLWSRLDAFQAASDVIGRNPYVGVGLDDRSSRVDVMGLELLSDGTAIFNRHQVHNLLLGSWYGAGLLGLLGVVAVLVATLQVGISSVRRATTHDERLLATSLLASFAGFVVFAQGTVVLYQRYGWIGSALILAVWVQQSRRNRDPRATSRPSSSPAMPRAITSDSRSPNWEVQLP